MHVFVLSKLDFKLSIVLMNMNVDDKNVEKIIYNV